MKPIIITKQNLFETLNFQIRNERKFILGQEIYLILSSNNDTFIISKGLITSVSFNDVEWFGKEYVYNVQVNDIYYNNITCNRIFETKEQAKAYMKRNLKRLYELRLKEIDGIK